MVIKAMVAIISISCLCMIPIVLSNYRDRWIWNRGICRRTGRPWSVIQMEDGRIKLRSLHVVKFVGRWVGSDEYGV